MDNHQDGTAHLYSRVSTQEQASGGYSLDQQQFQLTYHAQTRYPDKRIVLWSDPGVSAAVPLAKRKAGVDMIAALRAGDVLIVSRLDRMFRKAREAMTELAQFAGRQIAVVMLDLADTPITEADSSGRLRFDLIASFAEFEHSRIRERIADSRQARLSRGAPLGANVPFGFRREGKRQNARLVEDVGHQQIRALIRTLYQNGHSYASIARELAARGHRGRSGNLIIGSTIGKWLERDGLVTLGPLTPERRKAALAEALATKRAAGQTVGNPNMREVAMSAQTAKRARFTERVAAVAPILRKIHAAGVATSYNDVANRLNHAKIPTYGPQQGRTRPGGPIWHTAIVRRIMQQLGLPDPQCAGRRRIRATRPSTAQRDAAIAPVIRELIAAGASDFHAIAAALNEAAHTTHSGQGLWHPGSVSKVMRRLGLSSSCASGAGHRKKSRQPWSPETYRGFARPPFGWRLAESGEGLVEVEHEQMVIAAICALRAAGGSYRAIARQIDEQHGVKFSSSIIMGILDRAAGVTNQPTSRRDRPHRVPDYSARSARSARTIAVRNAAGDSVVAPVIRDLLANGAASLNDIVTSLNERGIPTYSNRGHWHQATLLKVMQRLGLSSPWTGPAKNLRRPWQPPAQSETRSGRPSFGWHRPKDGFVEDVTEQAVITAICEMRAAGSSYNAIARQIGEQYGLTLPTATVMRILERAAGVTAQR